MSENSIYLISSLNHNIPIFLFNTWITVIRSALMFDIKHFAVLLVP